MPSLVLSLQNGYYCCFALRSPTILKPFPELNLRIDYYCCFALRSPTVLKPSPELNLRIDFYCCFALGFPAIPGAFLVLGFQPTLLK